MSLDPIYQAAAFANGFAPMPAPVECYRCEQDPPGFVDMTEPDPTYCRPCLDEISHAIEMRHMEGAWSHLGEDGTDGGRFVA